VDLKLNENISMDFGANPSKRVYPIESTPALTTTLAIVYHLTGVDMENTILVFSLLLGFFTVFSAYAFAREFLPDKVFVFFTVFAIITASAYLIVSGWSSDKRGMFFPFYVAFLWSILKYDNTQNKKILVITALTLIFLIFVHRMALLAAPIILLYAVYRILHKLRIHARVLQAGIILTIAILFIFPFTQNNQFFASLRDEYTRGYLAEGKSNSKILLNMCVDYITSGGFMFVLMPIGFMITLKRLSTLPDNRKNLLITLFLTPYTFLLLKGEYLTLFLLPLFAIFSATAIKHLLDKSEKHIPHKIPYIILTVIILSTTTSLTMINHWITAYKPNTGIRYYMQERTAHATGYLRDKDGLVSTGYVFLHNRLLPNLQPNQVIFGHKNKFYRSMRIAYSHDLDNWLTAGLIGDELVGQNRTEVFFVEYKPLRGRYLIHHKPVGSPLYLSIHQRADKVYDNGLIDLWNIGFGEKYLAWGVSKKKRIEERIGPIF